MPQGRFPGQEQMLRRYAKIGLEAEGGFRRTRRRFLGFALGGAAVAGSCGWFAGRSAAVEPRTTATTLEDIALGPMARLEACATDLLAEIEQGRATPILWRGFERLATWSVARPELRTLRQRLGPTVRVATPPVDVQEVLRHLELR